jgi:ribosomal protein S18 acetylase RimI-like enzyme
MRATSIPDIALRRFREDEIPFLRTLYASTREEELGHLIDWTDAQKQGFLSSQFQLQHDHYLQHYPGATLDIIFEGTEPIGRLYVHRSHEEIRLMEVTLLPERRNRGIGGALTGEVLAEGAKAGCPVVLHVESASPAVRFYERLGFVDVGRSGIHQRMQWRPR